MGHNDPLAKTNLEVSYAYLAKNKYIKSKELKNVNEEEPLKNSIIEEELLDKINISGKQYYYEAKDKVLVYDSNSKPVGIFKNGKIIFN